MNMLFTYAYKGIPGLAHDAKILELAIEELHQFPIVPFGKYYQGDSSYPLRPGVITHEKYIILANTINLVHRVAINKCFNKRHFSLRFVIEKTFGV